MAYLLTIDRRATAWQVNKPIKDIGYADGETYYGFGLHSRSTTVFSTKVFVKTTGFRNVTPCTMLPENAASQPTKRTDLLGHR